MTNRTLSRRDALLLTAATTSLALLGLPGRARAEGLSLAAVKVELDRLRGSAAVESDSGAGTRFRFRLPTIPTLPGAPARAATVPERITE